MSDRTVIVAHLSAAPRAFPESERVSQLVPVWTKLQAASSSLIRCLWNMCCLAVRFLWNSGQSHAVREGHS